MVAPVRLFIGGLPATVRDDEVRARFAPFGDVRNIEVIRDTAFGGEQCRGFAYVELTAAEAELARCFKAYHGARWRGQVLSVEHAHPTHLERLRVEWDDAAREADESRAMAAAAASHLPVPVDLTRGTGRHMRFDDAALAAMEAVDDGDDGDAMEEEYSEEGVFCRAC